MARCANCRHNNSNDSKFCSKCGNPLDSVSTLRGQTYGRGYRERETCFGLPGAFWPLLIGMAIILWGISEIIRIYYGFEFPWWPIIVIIIGSTIVVKSIRRRI